MERVAAKLSETTIAEFPICRTRRRNTRCDDNPNPNSENQEAVSAKQKSSSVKHFMSLLFSYALL